MGKDLSMSYNITCKYGGQHANTENIYSTY